MTKVFGHEAIRTKEVNGGVQHLFRFPNHYGASVVRHQFSYGGDRGLWELAVIVFQKDDSEAFDLTYKTPITEDVEGYLSVEEVTKLLDQIAALPMAFDRTGGRRSV